MSKTLTTDRNGKTIMGDTTKTYAGMRNLPIPPFMLSFIMEQMKQGQLNKDNQLFLSSNGNLVDPRNANVALKKILKNNFNITGIATHSLRHTYATRCIEAGMMPSTVQRLLGQTDISTTLNTYTSVFNKLKFAEVNKVNDYYLNNELLPSEQLQLHTNKENIEDLER